MAEKTGAKATTLSASHVSMLAKPVEVAAVIVEAAARGGAVDKSDSSLEKAANR